MEKHSSIPLHTTNDNNTTSHTKVKCFCWNNNITIIQIRSKKQQIHAARHIKISQPNIIDFEIALFNNCTYIHTNG